MEHSRKPQFIKQIMGVKGGHVHVPVYVCVGVPVMCTVFTRE